MSDFEFHFDPWGESDDTTEAQEPAPEVVDEVPPVAPGLEADALAQQPDDFSEYDINFDRGEHIEDEVGAVVRPEISDEDVNRIFGEISDKVRQDEMVLRNAAIVIEAERELIRVAQEQERVLAEIAEEDRQIKELERELTRRKLHKAQLSEGNWQRSRDKNLAERAIREAQNAAKVAAENVKAEEDAAKGYADLLHRAKNFKWFTGVQNAQGETLKAMKHQMLAMSFMTTGKRCILGDKMGLGKTLSAIGSLDILDIKKTLIITPADITSNFQREIQFWTDHRPAINLKGQTRAMKQQMLSAIQILPVFTVVINYESWRRDPRLLTALADVGFDAIIMDEAHNMKNAQTDAFKGVLQITHAVNKCPRDGSIMPQQEGWDTKIEGGRKCKICGWAGESTYETTAEGSGLSDFADRFWLTRSVNYVFPMTGTAILNKPHDLFPLLHLIDPIRFAKESEYLRTYAQWDYDTGMYTFSPGGLKSLMIRLRGKYLARSMSDAGIVLPPQTPIVHQLSLENHREQLQVMRQITEMMQIVLTEEKKTSITAIIAWLTRQRQSSVWPGGIEIRDKDEESPTFGQVIWRVADEVTQSVKIDKAISLIHEYTAQGERVVVFSQFSTALRELHARVNNSTNDAGDLVSTVVFDGSTPTSVREEIKTNFDRKMGEAKKWDAVLANYKTGGVGLNLTAATHVIVLDREWNPGKEDQALARVFRIGQTENTFVHVLEIEGSIDEWMNEVINKKANMISGFDDGAEGLKQDLMKKMQKFLDDTKD